MCLTFAGPPGVPGKEGRRGRKGDKVIPIDNYYNHRQVMSMICADYNIISD